MVLSFICRSSRCSAHGWLLVGLACCCLGVCAGDVNVTAFVGESKVLPCSIPVDQTQEMTVRWHRGTKVIYEISAHGHYCSLTYCRPENVSVEEFLKGNCSLVLLNIAMEDAGKYKFHLGNRFYYVNLLVSENPTGGSSSATNSPHKGAKEDGQTWTVRDIAGVVVAVVAVGAVFAAVAVHLKKRGLIPGCCNCRGSDKNFDQPEDLELGRRLTESSEQKSP